MKLPPPKNQKAKILRRLILSKSVSERDFSLNGFRSRLHELKVHDGVNIQYTPIPFKNEFKHTGVYRERFIPDRSKPKAVRIYLRLNAA